MDIKHNSFENGKYYSLQNFDGGLRYEVNSIDDIQLIYNTKQWIRYIKNDICVDIFVMFKKGKNLLIFGQDALTEKRNDLPYFYRSKWNGYFDDSFITINDPTLYEDRGIRLGWFELKGSMDVTREILNMIIEKLKINQSKIFFYGASAGGYWALANVTYYPKATYIVVIPQINLKTTQYVEHIKKLEDLFKRNINTSVFDYWKVDKETSINKIYYFQNTKDFKHTREQCAYFTNKLSWYLSTGHHEIINQFNLRFYSLKEEKRGHSPMSIDDTVETIKQIILEENYMKISVKEDFWLKSLLIAKNKFEELGIKMFLSDGTLLGSQREKDFIEHDTDIDVGVFYKDIEPYLDTILEHLGNAKFKKNNYGIKFNALGKVRMDINFYYEENNKYYHTVYRTFTGKKGKIRRNYFKYEYEPFSLIDYEFLGEKFFIPTNPEKILEAQYGDWKIKREEWNYFEDPKNIKPLNNN